MPKYDIDIKMQEVYYVQLHDSRCPAQEKESLKNYNFIQQHAHPAFHKNSALRVSVFSKHKALDNDFSIRSSCIKHFCVKIEL